MKSSIPLFSRKGKIILLGVIGLVVGLIYLAIDTNPPQAAQPQQKTEVTTPQPRVDSNCREVIPFPGSTGTFVNGAYVADSIETLRIAFDMLKNNEQAPLFQLQVDEKLRWIGKGTKVSRIEGLSGYNASKIRPRGETGIWVILDKSLTYCMD
jgi:hypothetical protein